MQLIFQPDRRLPADGRLLFYRLDRDDPPLADITALGLGAEAEVRSVDLAIPTERGVQLRPIAVAAVPLHAALGVLIRGGGGLPDAPTLRAYARAARLATGLAVEHQIAPVLRQIGDDLVAQWRALLPTGGTFADVLTALADALPASGHALPRDATAVWHPYALLRTFVDAVVDLLAREPGAPQGEGERQRAGGRGSGGEGERQRGDGRRPRARLLPWTVRWREAAVDRVDPTVPLGVERGEVVAGVGEWLRPFEQLTAEHAPLLALVAPAEPARPWTLRFGLRDRAGERVSADQLWQHNDDRDRIEALLESLARAARVFPPVERALDQRQPTHAAFTTDVAWQFIDQIAPLLREAGYVVVLPDGLHELRPRIELRALDEAIGGEVELAWQGTVGDAVLDASTVDRLMQSPEPLAFWRDRWVRITPEVRVEWEQRQQGVRRVPLIEALGLAVAGAATGLGRVSASGVTQVTAAGPLAGLVDRVRQASAPEAVGVPPGFHGELRPYQLDAVGWLDTMADLRLGGVLADDMGLGKTVMLIAHLLRQGHGPHLVVCPTSVVANWERELARFAPDLPRVRHHGADRSDDASSLHGVVITSYGTLRRDIDLLAQVDWHVVALDEAHQVKNPDTLSARAVRRLRSRHCVALTGTPVENRLRELWSVLDFTNPGLLGPRARFERRYATPIERQGDQATRTRLRRMIAPFVLRRTKADPRVAVDLPPRIERTVPCVLTPEQRERYSTTVEVFREGAGRRSGMEYRGAVLALLTRLKQICDHPALGGAGGAHPVGGSGKLAVARQLVAEATQGGEQILIFTQFVTMADLLARDLSRSLRSEVPVLHGGMPAAARQRLIDQFQGETEQVAPPVLIASLRAGGVGMNLTAATQVIHYDRWWNPAVEDQASDRAHRIGQTDRVLIHKLVTMGTIEERIDAMLADKREIAEAVVGAGETWITELDVDQLLDLVELGAAAAAPDELVAGGRR